jgi:hypothetical protein
MARVRFSYSENNDYSKNQPRKSKRRSGAPKTTPYVPGPPPDTSAGFLPKNLSEEQRRELRARQLAASQYVEPDMPSVQAALPDRDLMRRPGDATDPRQVGGYHTLETGPDGGTPFPEILGPQERMWMRTLNEDEVAPPLHPDISPLPSSDINASLELIAAVSADDREILAFDNKMSDAHIALRNLRQAAERMVKSVARQDEKRGREDSVTGHARNLRRLLSTVIEPWFGVLEQEFEALLNETTQVTEMEEGR